MAASYRDYDPATLARLQALLHEMLADFDALCHKHGLHYFAGASGWLPAGGVNALPPKYTVPSLPS